MLIATGCAGYQLGPTNGMEAGSRAVQVNLFVNDTFEPRLSEAVGTSLRRWIQRDGTFRLATQNDADVLVEGILIDYDRSSLTYQPADVLTVRDYEINLAAKVKATEISTGRVLLDEKVNGRTIIRAGRDLSSAERQAVPLLAEDLARNITTRLVDGTW